MPRVAQALRDAPTRMRTEAVSREVKAAEYLEAQLQQTCGLPGTERNRSRIGEAPRRQTGRGQASIQARVDPSTLILTVVAIGYMAWHNDHGRPWFEITWRRVGPQFRRILFGQTS